jgi:hypothetical protein
MQAESLEVLEKASVAPAQARAIVRAIEIEIAGAKDTLATKHHLVGLRTDLRGDMAELRTELRGEMKDLAAALRTEVAKMGGELRVEIAGVTRQMYLALLGQMAVMLGFFYFFLTQLR